MTSITKIGVWILIIAVIVLVILQWRSCKDKTADILTTDKAAIQKSKDSLDAIHKVTLANDSLLRIRYKTDSVHFAITLDSLQKENTKMQSKFLSVKSQLATTVAQLSDVISNGSDTQLIAQLNNLKDQLAEANDIVFSLQTNSGAQDSVLINEIDYKNLVIYQKDSTIDALGKEYTTLQALYQKTQTDLATAINDLKKGKRLNVLRTIAEAALVVGLIIK